jgi:hypothetical protein
MTGFEVYGDLTPTDDQLDAVRGGELASASAQSPLTLGIGQQANTNFGNGPIVGGHINITL